MAEAETAGVEPTAAGGVKVRRALRFAYVLPQKPATSA